jgi:hypothetical protein|tara:strand:+ start:180 stop:611 length:432 start_codon:yes stop_codon:yes gene_type:complete
MYVIDGEHKNPVIVQLYMMNLIEALKINRFTARFVKVSFKETLECEDYEEVQGLCSGDQQLAQVSIATKGHTFLRQMQTLAHEMVHAKQMLRKELVIDEAYKWKGRNANNYEYENQPWEKEAYRLERELFLDCFPFDHYDIEV